MVKCKNGVIFIAIFLILERFVFDIKGLQTGLVSKVMKSPCNKIIIPINEPTEKKSQIQEYLDEYHGSGIQHVALLTSDIIRTVTNMKKQGIEFWMYRIHTMTKSMSGSQMFPKT